MRSPTHPILIAIAALATLGPMGCGDTSEPKPGPGNTHSGGSGGQSVGGAGGTGTGGGELEVQALMYTPIDLPVEVLSDGSAMELWRAPQGGFVLLAGARVAGLESDTIELTARLWDPRTDELISEQSRTVVMEDVPELPGTQQTDRRSRSQVSHVPVCPNYGPTPISGQPYVLEVLVTELYADFSEGSVRIEITPTCMADDAASRAFCECQCGANYEPGTCDSPG